MSSSENAVTLFDLKSRHPENRCWSSNVWKTRLALNYKSIPYTSHFLSHPEIALHLSALGAAPNPPATRPGPPVTPYTVPAIQLPDGQVVIDSAVIAPKLEELYPEPSLRLENGLHEKIVPVLGACANQLRPVFFPRVGRNMLPLEVVPRWRANREEQLGMTLEEWEAKEGGEKAWEAAKPAMAKLSEFLKECKVDDGPFLLGSQVCYGDFIFAAMLEGLRRSGGNVFERVVEHDEAFRKLHGACKPWFENDE